MSVNTGNEPADLCFVPGTCAGPVNYDEIADTERACEFRFDPLLVALLERCNGGVPTRRYFSVPGNVRVIERFLCVIADVGADEVHGWYDIGAVTAQIESRLGAQMVPFAALFAGDLLCLDGAGSDPPKVVVWDHERSDEDSPVTTPVADDFRDFLALLSADPA